VKRHPLAYVVVKHLRMRPHLASKPQPLDNPVVQIDEFLFAKLVDIDFHVDL